MQPTAIVITTTAATAKYCCWRVNKCGKCCRVATTAQFLALNAHKRIENMKYIGFHKMYVTIRRRRGIYHKVYIF